MTTAYSKPAQRHRAPDPALVAALSDTINQITPLPTGYAYDRMLDIPVRLDNVIIDRFNNRVTAEDLATAQLLYSELMEMDFTQAMVMPYSVLNGPVRTCFATYLQEHDERWEAIRGDVMTALTKAYEDGMNGRPIGTAGE
jgi:hypothetical protein